MRLETEYRDQFVLKGASGFEAWWNKTTVQADVFFGDRSGPVWSAGVRYGRRRLPFGRVESLMPLDEAIQELCRQLDEYLAKGAPRPRVFGKQQPPPSK